MSDPLCCTKLIRINDGKDMQGRPVSYHVRCGKPASEIEIGGTLTRAKAVLCKRHALEADRQAFTSKNGFPLGKIEKRLKEQGYSQQRLPGTGVIK